MICRVPLERICANLFTHADCQWQLDTYQASGLQAVDFNCDEFVMHAGAPAALQLGHALPTGTSGGTAGCSTNTIQQVML
jgi:hypothetical protein